MPSKEKAVVERLTLKRSFNTQSKKKIVLGWREYKQHDKFRIRKESYRHLKKISYRLN